MKTKNHFYAAVFLSFCGLLLFSCGTNRQVDGIVIINGTAGGDEFAVERESLEQLLLQTDFLDNLGLRLIRENMVGEQEGMNKAQVRPPALIIDFEVSWTPTTGILISRTWFVPREDPLTERTGTSLAACLAGNETLVPIGEIAPPYVGLLVDGLCADDENYPLVKHVSINIRAADEKTGQKKRMGEKLAALETALTQAPKPLVQNTPQIVWICSSGDLMLERGSGDILINEGAGGIFGKTADYYKRSDLNLINLEGAVSTRGIKAPKSFTFRFDPRVLPPLKAAGIHAVLLANNHTFDYGNIAFLDTLEHLEKNRIGYVGAGHNIAAATAPFVFQADQLEIRVFGIGSYPIERTGWDGAAHSAAEDKAGMLIARRSSADSAERLKKNFVQSDGVLNVLLFHGGDEWTWKPSASTRSLYTDLAQSGADLLIGTHPHTVQGFEWLDGKLIFWSLGNYVFTGNEGTDGGEEGLLIRLGYSGKTLIYLEPVPVVLKGARSDIGPAEQLDRFYALSRELRQNEN